MRVLLIGGSGFIGPHVVAELLRLGQHVTVFHRGSKRVPESVAEILGDRRHLLDYTSTLRASAPDVVVDMVLGSAERARDTVEVFRGVAQRVVALSSMDVYRACGVLHRLEEGPLEPLPLAEASPLRAKLQTYPPAQLRTLQQIFGWLDDSYDKIPVERTILGDSTLSGTVLRLPMVYGAGDPLHRFQPIVKRVTDGRRSILFSDQSAQWRGTKGYVENVGAAIALAAISDHAVHRIYNIGEPDTLSELEWAQQVARAMSWDGEFVTVRDAAAPLHLRAPGNAAQHWVADTTRFREEFGYREAVSRREAIRRTVQWERTNPPTGFSPHQFDYDAEDSALNMANPRGA